MFLEMLQMAMVQTKTLICAKLKSGHHQDTNTQFLTSRLPFLPPNQQCQSTEGESRPTWMKYEVPPTLL